MFSFDVCLSIMCMYLCAVEQPIKPVDNIIEMPILLRTPNNCQACVHGQFEHDPLKFFEKEAWPGSREKVHLAEIILCTLTSASAF